MFDARTWGSEIELASAIFLSAAWKSSVLFLLAGGLTRLLSRRSAAIRHGVWTTAMAGALVIPVLEFVLPAWELPVPVAVSSIVESTSSQETPASSPSEAVGRLNGSIVAMLEGPAFERTMLDQESADDENNIPISSLAMPSVVGDSTSAAKITWLSPVWLLSAWLLGTIGMLIPLAAGIAGLKRLELRSERPAAAVLSRQLADIARELGLGRRVTLLVSDIRAIPMTWGTLWPVLLLPREAQNWPADRLRIVLLHELVHVARCDYLFQLVGALARAMYWFNPLAWWGFRRLKIELEQACDDRVLFAGTQAETYAFELLHITSQFPSPGFTPSAALAMGRSARIQRRIESILDPSRNRTPLTRRFACAAALAGFLLTAAVASVHEVRGQAAPETQPAVDAATISSDANQATSRLESKSADSKLAEAKSAESNTATQETGREAAKKAGRPAVTGDAPQAAATDRLSEIRMQILKSYVKSPDARALDEGAIRGMLQALDDPHSEFLSRDKLKEFERAIEGRLTGIGIEVSTSEKQLLVIAPLPGSPADAAGLKPGDAILAVDGKTVQDLGAAAAIDAIRGKAGTVVSLRVKRASGEEAMMNVTRGSISMPTVKGLWFDKSTRKWNFWLDQEQKLGYIHVTDFGKQTAEDCQSAVKTLLDQSLKGLVVDLRHCPGGLLGVVVDVAELFLREGTIVSIKGEQTPETTQRATGNKYLGDFPLLVLVDEHTASAAEILAGALKENGRATILGTRTFGKGSVQSILPVEGSGAIRLTTAYFYLPGGRSIDRQKGTDAWGVDPTDGYYVSLSPEQQDQWLKARRKWEIAGDALRGPHQGNRAISAAIEGILSDPQLAAAYQSIAARLASGAFLKVGQSEQALRDHLARREQLLRARAEAQKQLDSIEKELSATSGAAGR